jgi:hypothetical protein
MAELQDSFDLLVEEASSVCTKWGLQIQFFTKTIKEEE